MSLIEGLGGRIGAWGPARAHAHHQRQPAFAFCAPCTAPGVRRINVSLDTRDPEKFRAITRWGDLAKVLAGIDAAQDAGLAVKINMVALKDINEDEIEDMLAWAHGRGMDLTLIETMPMGEIDGDRVAQYLPLSLVRARLARKLHARG
jgi:cyclic pyranopterin phosphate synthase